MTRDPIIGIDLGTTNAVAARCDETGTPIVLANERGQKIHPSVVSFHPSGAVVVGAEAKQRRIIDPRNTVYSAKRLIGRPFRSREIHAAMQRMPYAIKEGANQQPVIVTRGGELAVPEISAIVLDHVRGIASKALGTEVSRAVVTVPASFNDAQRSATATAGAIAGITVVRVLNEPTAAALAYGHTRKLSRVIAVYDFGGGTFDVTILRLQDQVYEVLATAGDSFLGGDDIDEALTTHMADVCVSRLRTDVRTNEVAMMRLRAVAEQAKIELSRRHRALVKVDEIAYGAGGAPLHLETEITRDQLVGMASPLIERTFKVCEEALTLSGLAPSAIEDVVLVGGSTKIPQVRERVTQFFQRAPRSDLDPEEAVAMGAALQAAALERILSRRTTGRQSVTIPPTAQVDQPAPVASRPSGNTSWDEDITNTAANPGAAGAAARRAPAPQRVTDRAPAMPPIPTVPAANARSKTMIGVVAEPIDTSESGAIDLGPLDDSLPPPQIERNAYAPAESWALEEPTAPPGPPPAPPSPTRAPDTLRNPPNRAPAAGPGARTMIGEAPGPAARTMIGEAPAPPMAPPPIPRGAPDARTMITTAPERPAPERTTDRGPAIARPPGPSIGDAAVFGATTTPGVPLGPPAPPVPGAPRAGTASQPGFSPPGAASQPGFSPPSASQPGFSPPAFAPPAATPPPRPGAASQPGFGPPPSPTPRPAHPAAQTSPSAEAALAAVTGAAPMLAPPRGPTVVEVVPRSLGIGTVAGYCEELIRRNSRVPAETRRMFSTSRDQQQTVRIRVFQGESRRIDENAILGDLVLDNLPARPRGGTSIEVFFSVDASGILRVRARDAQTGQEQRASLDLVGTQSAEEVDAARERFAALRR